MQNFTEDLVSKIKIHSQALFYRISTLALREQERELDPQLNRSH